MKLWKKVITGILSFVILGVLGIYMYMQVPGDVRSDYARREGESAVARQKGRALLERSIKKLDPGARWKKLRSRAIKITFRHFWYNAMLRTFFMPLEQSGQKLSLLLKPGQVDARLTFLDGQWKGKSWGIQKGAAYQVDDTGTLTWKRDRTIEFHVPGYRYFFFMPYYLSEARLITYAGERKLHGHTYDLVYSTWGKWTPQKNVDQYLLWINRETSMIDFVQSTVREMFARSIVTLSLSDYRKVHGIKMPFSLTVLENIKILDAGMHQMKLLEVEQVEGDVSGLLFPAPGRLIETK